MQNQALSALLFLYRHVLGREIGNLGEVLRARKPKRLPVVMTREEVKAFLGKLTGDKWLMANLGGRMIGMKSLLALLFAVCPLAAAAENPVPAKLPSPEVNKDSWVMVEIWPDVKDITLSAYFPDFSYKKNRNLCEATKRVFDRDQEARSKSSGKEMSSYRRCMSVDDAVAQGYIRGR